MTAGRMNMYIDIQHKGESTEETVSIATHCYHNSVTNSEQCRQKPL